jgi:protein-tyrosine-phosphatase
MAAALFNHKIREKNLSGARATFCGMNVEFGSEILPESKAALKKYGVKRVCGAPEQIAGKHLAQNNLIICLTDDHKIALQRMVADKFVDKIICFADFCGVNIADPYGKGQPAYDSCIAQINSALDILIKLLDSQGFVKYKPNKK